MMKNINIRIVAVVMTVSLIVMFGGWLLHLDFGVKKPMEASLLKIQGVKESHITIDRHQINVTIALANIDDLQKTYRSIKEVVTPYLSKRELKLTIKNNENPDMIKGWKQNYFYIAEAIDTHQYSLIPETVQHMKEQLNLDKVGYSMDDENIYIDLHKKDASLFLVLPKNSNVMGVKNLG